MKKTYMQPTLNCTAVVANQYFLAASGPVPPTAMYDDDGDAVDGDESLARSFSVWDDDEEETVEDYF